MGEKGSDVMKIQFLKIILIASALILILTLQGCMLMHFAGDHHSKMMGHDKESHGADKGGVHQVGGNQMIVPLDEESHKDTQGGVTIEIQFDELTERGEIAFKVRMTDHSTALGSYKLDQMAFLSNDQGLQVPASRWRPFTPTMQHVIGKIYFPSKDSNGRPVVAQGVRKVILSIKGLGGIPERVFQWNVMAEH